MSIREKIAYIKGLAEGLKLDENKDEVKVLKAVIELLDEMSDVVCETKDTLDGLSYSVEAIDDEFDFDDCDCDCGCDDEEVFYEVTCPTCGAEINVAEDVLLCGETTCPKCGEFLEFDFSSLDEDDDDCDCGCCSSDDDEDSEE